MLPTVQTEHFPTGPKIVTLPPGHSAQVFIPQRIRDFREETVKVRDMASFLAYLNHQCVSGQNLAIFIDATARTFTAILDYPTGHPRPRPSVEIACGLEPAAAAHRLHLQLQFDPEFEALRSVINEFVTQEQFCEFVESWSRIFMEASSLLTLASEFESMTEVKFKRVIRPQSGTGTLVYDTQEKADATTKLPEKVTTQLSVFAGQNPQMLEFLLRYRLSKEGLKICLALPSLEAMLLDAVNTAQSQMVETLQSHVRFTGHLIVNGTAPATALVEAKSIFLASLALPHGYTITEGDHVDESVSFSDPRPSHPCPGPPAWASMTTDQLATGNAQYSGNVVGGSTEQDG